MTVTHVNVDNSGDLAAVAAVQDQFVLEVAGERPFAMPDYDTASLDRTRAASPRT